MAECCSGSRLGSGCEFVNGSGARNTVKNRSDRSTVATQPLAASGYEEPTFSEAFDERAAELFEPLTEAADNAVDYWVEQGGVTGAAFGTSAAATVDSNNIGNTVSTAGTAYVGGTVLRGAGAAIGPLKQWIRLGPSYSRALGRSAHLFQCPCAGEPRPQKAAFTFNRLGARPSSSSISGSGRSEFRSTVGEPPIPVIYT